MGQFDHNKDGELDRTERGRCCTALLKKYDKNNNGILDGKELESYKKDRALYDKRMKQERQKKSEKSSES